MMRRPPLLWMALLCFTASSARGEDPLRRFEADYPAASRRLHDFYTNLRVSGTTTGGHVKRWEFRGNGELRRCVVEREDGSASVIVANPKLSFTLERAAGSGHYSVTAMGPAPPQEYEDLTRTIRRKALPAGVPYAILADPIRGFLAEPSFRLKSGRELEGPDGGKLVRIEWENSPEDGPRRRGSFDFAPDASWALRAYDFFFLDQKNGDTGRLMDIGRHGIIEYQGEHAGVPLVRRVTTWTSGPGGRSDPEVHEVAQIEPGPVPRDEFTLEAFGIPTTPVAERTPAAYYLLGMAAISALLVLVLVLLRGRSTRSPGTA